MISKWRYLLKKWSFERVDNTFAAILKSQGLFMTVQIERVTLHSWSSMFLFYFSTDLIRITITSESNEIMIILPSKLQRVNMSHSNFFQLDLLAVFVIKVGYVLIMRCSTTWFWGSVTGSSVLCKRRKILIKIQNMCFTFPIGVGFLLVLWTSVLLNFVFGTMKFHNYLWLFFHLPEHLLLRNTGKETYFLSCKGYYNR